MKAIIYMLNHLLLLENLLMKIILGSYEKFLFIHSSAIFLLLFLTNFIINKNHLWPMKYEDIKGKALPYVERNTLNKAIHSKKRYPNDSNIGLFINDFIEDLFKQKDKKASHLSNIVYKSITNQIWINDNLVIKDIWVDDFFVPNKDQFLMYKDKFMEENNDLFNFTIFYSITSKKHFENRFLTSLITYFSLRNAYDRHFPMMKYK